MVHPPPPGAEFFVHREGEERLKTIADWISQIGQALAAKGKVTLEGYEISPADPSEYRVVYERMPRGEMSLKIELKWWPNAKEHKPDQGGGLPKVETES